MGYLHAPNGFGMTADQYFRKSIEKDGYGTVLASATVHLHEYYAAVRVDGDGYSVPKGTVFALVCKIDHSRGVGFDGYKEMDEAMGPCYYNCPEKILDLLTEPTNEYAASWREECRKRIADKKAQPRLKEGMVVRLVGAENYTQYRTYGDTFTVATYTGRGRKQRCFRSHKSGTLVRYGRSARWEVVEAITTHPDGSQEVHVA